MSLNKVILIGNVGKDPDVKYFDNGNCVANLTLATNERGYTTSNGTQVPERTDWHNIVVRRDNVPFVERTASFLLGSICVASSNAFANALNAASIMW